MKIYADTSFLISLYSLDVNSVSAAETMRRSTGHRYITVFGELEVVNALQLRICRKELSAAQVRLSLDDFEKDLRDGIWFLRPLSDQAFERARQLSEQTTGRIGTRTADLLHVASALELGAVWLFSFDERQRKLGRAVGLKLN